MLIWYDGAAAVVAAVAAVVAAAAAVVVAGTLSVAGECSSDWGWFSSLSCCIFSQVVLRTDSEFSLVGVATVVSIIVPPYSVTLEATAGPIVNRPRPLQLSWQVCEFSMVVIDISTLS